jgi:hypothetical protein
MAVKKGTAKKKAPVKKKTTAAVKKAAPKKKVVAAKKAASKKPVAKKSVAKKSPVKKSSAKKAAPKKKAAVKKKPLAKKGTLAKKSPPAKRSKVAKRKTAVAPTRKITAISERYSKTDIVNELASNSGLNRKQIGIVLDELAILIARHIKKRSVGEFILAGLIKITTVKRPAKKARTGINPFTGKLTKFKAKPATTAVKVHALKGLKDMAQ